MDNEEKKESFVEKAKAQLDALKTQEGREAIKDKLKENASRLRSKPGIAWGLGVLVAVLLVMIFLIRSCSNQTPAPIPSDSQQSAVKKDAVPKFDGSVNLTKADKKKGSPKTFLGFTFGAKADEFEDVKAIEQKNVKDLFIYTTTQGLKKKFRLFKSAHLKFTSKDKRLYKIKIETDAKDLVGFNPIAVLREAQYCAAMIERKYGGRFNLASNVELFSREEKSNSEISHNRLADELGSSKYGNIRNWTGSLGFNDSSYAIAPYAFYHGFFDNTIEIKCCCTYFSDHYGVWISAMDHSVIAEDGGRTKDIPLDADDDEDNL